MRLVVTSVCARAGNASASARTAMPKGRTRDRRNAALLIKLLLSELNRTINFNALISMRIYPICGTKGEKTFQELSEPHLHPIQFFGPKNGGLNDFKDLPGRGRSACWNLHVLHVCK